MELPEIFTEICGNAHETSGNVSWKLPELSIELPEMFMEISGNISVKNMFFP
jgi:hypothetical protein